MKSLISGCAKLFVSLRATADLSQSVAVASFHSVQLAMTNAQLILPKYLSPSLSFKFDPIRFENRLSVYINLRLRLIV